MRNRWGIEIKKGYHAWGTWGNSRAPVDGVVTRIDRSSDFARAYGPQVTLQDSRGEFTIGADEISEVLPPMRVTKGGVVKANPVTEARELWLYGRNKFEIVNASRHAFQSNATAAQWKAIALKAARMYSSEFGNGSAAWRDIFSDDDLKVTASMLRDDMQNEAEDDSHYPNPTPRLKSPTQKSQRMRVDPKTGALTNKVRKGSRLYERRLKTHHLAPPGVWANPITRVKLKSPSMRDGEAPSERLVKRRRKTAKAPAGFYANPLEANIKNSRAQASAAAPDTMNAWRDVFILQMKRPSERKWTTIGIDDDRRSAEARIRGLARTGPDKMWRLVTPD